MDLVLSYLKGYWMLWSESDLTEADEYSSCSLFVAD